MTGQRRRLSYVEAEMVVVTTSPVAPSGRAGLPFKVTDSAPALPAVRVIDRCTAYSMRSPAFAVREGERVPSTLTDSQQGSVSVSTTTSGACPAPAAGGA